MKYNTYGGFTLVELLVTVSVLAIILGVAVPSMQSMIERSRITGASERLLADLQFMRSEAIKLNSDITLSMTTGDAWCFGFSDNGNCNCATSNSCKVNGLEKVVSAADYSGSGTTLAVVGITNTTFSRRNGTVNNIGSATFSGSNGTSARIDLRLLGRASICSDDIASYPGC